MRCYTQPHPFYGGMALPARTMDVCMLDQPGESLLHRHLPARPETLLQAIAPSRAALGVAVAGMFPWYGLADLCPRAGLAVVRGHALSMHALHGGKAQNDNLDSHQIAVLLRGGLRPQASVSPAAMRATRARLRRRRPLRRKRAERCAHVQPPNRQEHWPALGKTSASKATRAGGAERCPAPAVPKRLAVDSAWIDDDARRRSALEW
jgi:hypothetical protein